MKSIEIISLPFGQTRELEEGFRHPRYAFNMLTVGGGFPRILAIGGSKDDKSIEIWDEENQTWSEAPYTMKSNRYDFGSLAVPESVICDKSLKK